jgi:hypothetical protein
MARSKSSIFETLEAQGRQVLKLLNAEIGELEGRLDELRDQAGRWAAAIGLSGKSRGPGRPRGPAAGSAFAAPKKSAGPRTRVSPAVDWETVLQKLPKKFTKADLERATPKLKAHPQARVIAVARWSRAQQIRKVGDGVYQKA